MACVYVYVIIVTFLGPEYLGRDFHVENDEDMAIAAGTTHGHGHERGFETGESSDDGKGSSRLDEKHDGMRNV